MCTHWVDGDSSGCHPFIQVVKTHPDVVLNRIDLGEIPLLSGPPEVVSQGLAEDVPTLNKHDSERLELSPVAERESVCVRVFFVCVQQRHSIKCQVGALMHLGEFEFETEEKRSCVADIWQTKHCKLSYNGCILVLPHPHPRPQHHHLTTSPRPVIRGEKCKDGCAQT